MPRRVLLVVGLLVLLAGVYVTTHSSDQVRAVSVVPATTICAGERLAGRRRRCERQSLLTIRHTHTGVDPRQ